MRFAQFTTAAALLLTASAAGAQTTLITSKAAFGTPQGVVSWTQLGADLSFPANPSNFTVTGMPSLTGVVGEFDFHFQRRTEGVDFSGSFAHGDNLLWTVGNNGPMTFDFSSPITSFGTQVDQDFYGNALTQIYAYDSHNNLLGWGQEFFVATDGDDNTAPFIGISSTTGISRIVLYGSDRVGGNDFAINDVLIDGEGTTAPEPASIVLFATGMGAIVAVRRRRTRHR